jgi:LmbE family N-acetylglucosaminyl deacetylase
VTSSLPRPYGTGPIGVVSPHLDDAVLSCSSAITPGSVVLTVFASGPARLDRLTAWDAAAGFSPGDDVFAVRFQEDDEALAQLGASGRRLAFWEAPYRESPPRWPRLLHLTQRLTGRTSKVDEALAEQVLSSLTSIIGTIGLDTWFAPLGICNPDHEILGAILPRLIAHTGEISWYVYDDMPYSLERPADRDRAHRQLEAAGLTLERLGTSADPERKRASLRCYRSQLGPLGDRVEASIGSPEPIYRVVNR